MKKLLINIFLVVALFGLCMGQGSYTSPFLTAGAGLTLNYTSGTIINGGETQAITGATLSMADNQTNCTQPSFSSCNIIYWTSGGSLSVTQTLATATATSNVVVGYVKTSAGAITKVTHANSNIPFPNGIGQTAAFTSAPVPNAAAGVAVGSNALPFSSLFIGTAATNNQNILPSVTSAARSIKLADQGANGAVAFGDQTDATKVFLFDSHLATTGTTYSFIHNLAVSRSLNLTDQGANGALAFGDQTDPTKIFLFDSHSATTAKTATIAFTGANSRTFTLPEPGGNGTFMMTNNNASTVQVVSGQNSFTGNKAILTTDFTDANSAGLQVITGLSFTFPTSFVGNITFHCALSFSQATPVASDQFGLAVLTTAPTRADAVALVGTNTTAFATGPLTNLTTTTPTAIITFTEVASSVMPAYLDGTVQLPGGGSQVLQFYVTNGTSANLIVVKAGSYCSVL